MDWGLITKPCAEGFRFGFKPVEKNVKLLINIWCTKQGAELIKLFNFCSPNWMVFCYISFCRELVTLVKWDNWECAPEDLTLI